MNDLPDCMYNYRPSYSELFNIEDKRNDIGDQKYDDEYYEDCK